MADLFSRVRTDRTFGVLPDQGVAASPVTGAGYSLGGLSGAAGECEQFAGGVAIERLTPNVDMRQAGPRIAALGFNTPFALLKRFKMTTIDAGEIQRQAVMPVIMKMRFP
jgi:hypothetical protein